MTVASWGTGQPDYFVTTLPARPSAPSETQEEWVDSNEYRISAQSSNIASFYTIPEGYELSLGGGYISCGLSCINKLKIYSTTETLVADLSFDIRGDILSSALTGQKASAGDVLTIQIWNNNVLEDDFTVTLSGILEVVS